MRFASGTVSVGTESAEMSSIGKLAIIGESGSLHAANAQTATEVKMFFAFIEMMIDFLLQK
jgi:hypothetical protein